MLFVMTAKFRDGLTRAERHGALARRAAWSYPAGMRVVGEYWPASEQVAVLSIAEADSFSPIMQVVLEWQDVLQIEFSPAITAEEGLKVGPQLMGNLTAAAT